MLYDGRHEIWKNKIFVLWYSKGPWCSYCISLYFCFRFECRDYFPNSLPKVLLSIQWNNHEDVARVCVLMNYCLPNTFAHICHLSVSLTWSMTFQMHALLQSWPHIAPEQALELLDYKYPEKEVREYAVQCLENFTWVLVLLKYSFWEYFCHYFMYDLIHTDFDYLI